MAIKGLEELLARWKSGEIENASAFESELNKALAPDWTPKSVFNELNEKHKLADSQLKDAQSQLETLKSKAGLSDEYKAQIEKMTSDHANAKAEFEKQMKDMRNDFALTSALSKANARDAKLVKAVIDSTKLTFNEDGTIGGLEDQLKTAKESYSYLFDADSEAEIKKPSFGASSGSHTTGKTDSLLDAMKASAGL